MHEFNIDFPKAYGPITASALFRSVPEDFQVVENLGFTPAGEGEHIYLHIVKCGQNTAYVAEQIARLAGVKPMDVSYAGRKDRHAITWQWFSVYLPEKNTPASLDWHELDNASVKVLQVLRHTKKLRRGEHASNSFVIRLRDVVTTDRAALDHKIAQVLASGVPNYYGEQRFGIDANNLRDVDAWFAGARVHKDKQSILLSAARSYLFNRVLAARVNEANWCALVEGEPLEEPSSPLWGRGRPLSTDALLAFESRVLEPFAVWRDALEHKGLKQERRANLLTVTDSRFHWVDDTSVELAFTLGSGEFATAVLAELFHLEVSSPDPMR